MMTTTMALLWGAQPVGAGGQVGGFRAFLARMLEPAKQKHPPQQAKQVGAKIPVLGYFEKDGNRGVGVRTPPRFGGAGDLGAAGPPGGLSLIENTLVPLTLLKHAMTLLGDHNLCPCLETTRGGT